MIVEPEPEPVKAEVVAFEPSEVNHAGKVWIDSRMIHTFVKSKREYATWFKQRIEDIGMVEGVDFTVDKFVNGKATQIDYLVTPDIAKELGMMERNAAGRAIRKWFIAREEKLGQIEAAPVRQITFDPLDPVQLLQHYAKKTIELTAEVVEVQIKGCFETEHPYKCWSARSYGD